MPKFVATVTRELLTVTQQKADIAVEAEDLAAAQTMIEAALEKGGAEWQTTSVEEGVEDTCVGEIGEIVSDARGGGP